jgi:hypothetical protein
MERKRGLDSNEEGLAVGGMVGVRPRATAAEEELLLGRRESRLCDGEMGSGK